ncbi:MAG: oxygenase MpaB family protein [Gammaproteobacteria bacterium]|jgi:uncharacterized protein (DUF2236 family)
MESEPMQPDDRDSFTQFLHSLGLNVAADAGFFLPDSIFWQVSREPALLLAGMRALLLQIAHPAVAQGVADHSRYREDPLGRGIRTFTAVYAIVFGYRDEAIAAARQVRIVHDHVHGKIRDPLPPGMKPEYDANDPELQFWVAATLLDSAVIAYELFVTPLTDEQKEQHYQQAKVFGEFFGIGKERYPESWHDFQNWWQQMLASDTLTVTDTARDIYSGLLTGTWLSRLLAPINYSVAVMLLPERLCHSYGLRRSYWARFIFTLITWSTRVLVRLVPRGLRGVPAARRRE